MTKNEERLEKCRDILRHYGFEAQQDKLVEECEELIEAAQGEDYDSFIDELADVTIMITQMCISLEPEQYGQLEEMVDFKLDRTLERINDEVDT
jgi:NTP pyrophosphatase (non-canonical NTP hydrolase)